MRWIDGSEMPQPYRRLLVHDHDMTSELQNFHDDSISLEVLRWLRKENTYMREVILHASTSGQPVEYGVIEILLDSFPLDLHPPILEAHLPLGGILNDSGLPYHSEPQGFFAFPEAGLTGVFPGPPCGGILYGRYNHLVRPDHSKILAKIIEILPVENEGKNG